MRLDVFVLAAVLLAVERVAYIWISRRPEAFERGIAAVPVLADAGPMGAVRLLFTGFKLLQGAVFAAWCAAHGGVLPAPAGVRVPAVVAGAALVAAGQYLNMRVFALLGHDGVFYGNRFGVALPWVRAFPFSMLRHPQYVGAVLSIWGLFLAVRFPSADWIALPMLETLYYAVGSRLER